MTDKEQWQETNNRHIGATVTWVRLLLQDMIERRSQTGEFSLADDQLTAAYAQIADFESQQPPPALILLANSLGLSRFDCMVLMLCVSVEMDPHLPDLCALAQNDNKKPWPTFSLAFSLFENPDWNSLSPHSPLRHWRLLDINQPGAQALTAAALRIDERIMNYLKGLNYLDDRLVPLLDPTGFDTSDDSLPHSQQLAVEHIVNQLESAESDTIAPVVGFLGHDLESKRLVASALAKRTGVNLYRIDARTLPEQTGDLELLIRLWQRECLLMPLALYVETGDADPGSNTNLRRFLDRIGGIVIVDLQDDRRLISRNQLAIEISKPAPEEQEQIWIHHLPGVARRVPQRLSEQFSFNQCEIQRISRIAQPEPDPTDIQQRPSIEEILWQECRLAARAGMEQLAQRIDVKADWDQLVLPAEQKYLLEQIVHQVANRSTVYKDWGFRERMNRGLGINALFAGESGTGKTMAAEVIASALQLDLYRIDLSSTVSKYIGETEKNLKRLFDAAEDSGAILFCDECDALFGKRSEVKDSHDRYANIEVNYLLQRMESYRGLAILATNMKNALDKAFVRRLRFIVEFPVPDAVQREAIWSQVFPEKTPVDHDLDYARLAKLAITGGNIRNIAMNAAFLAAQQNGLITMPLILSAARTEFDKLERPAKESDFAWKTNLDVAV